MAAIPKATVEDDFVRGLTCAICGRPELLVQHLPTYPDFVACRSCNAAFVVEDTGERVMYGKIPDDYPETSGFALRQWVWLEAVDRKAREERPRPAAEAVMAGAALQDSLAPAAAEETEVPEDEFAGEVLTPEAPPEAEPEWLAERLATGAVLADAANVPPPEADQGPAAVGSALPPPVAKEEPLPPWAVAAAAAAMPGVPAAAAGVPPAPPAAAAPAEGPPPIPRLPIIAPAAAGAAVVAAAPADQGEPPPTHRHRVVIRGDRLRMPIQACAHCQRSPAPARLPVAGSLPRPVNPPQRRPATFQVPLCSDCNRRANTPSPEQRNATLMAHLIGALVGLVLVVVVLAVNVLPFATNRPLGLVLLAATWIVGYAFTAFALLGRARRAPASADAVYVRTTLQVVADSAAPQTDFEWRNRETAMSFFHTNASVSLGEPEPIPEAAPGT